MKSPRKEVLYWSLYDWANSAFYTTVIAGFFPVFFKSYWCRGLSSVESTSILGTTHATASIAAALLAPLIGILGARYSRFQKILWYSIILGAFATLLFAWIPTGMWAAAALLAIFSQIAMSASLVCYDSLLPRVSRGRSAENVSALGYSLGYLGGGLQFLFCVLLFKSPATFGLEDPAQAVKISFAFVGVWWLVFSLPLLRLRLAPDSGLHLENPGIGETLRFLRRNMSGSRSALVFLAAYWLYIDGVNSVVKMALDYGLSIGLQSSDLITALLITQFVGFPATILFGLLGTRIGAAKAILIGVAGYAALTVWGSLITTSREFYAIAIAVGLLQGGVQSLSRALFARIVPETNRTTFFGIFNMVSRFATILGPLLIAGFTMLTGDHRIGVLSLLLLFVTGGGLLMTINLNLSRSPSR